MRKLLKERKLFKGGNYMRKYGTLIFPSERARSSNFKAHKIGNHVDSCGVWHSHFSILVISNGRLKNITTPTFQPWTFQPWHFNHKLFNSELFNHDYGVLKFEIKSWLWKDQSFRFSSFPGPSQYNFGGQDRYSGSKTVVIFFQAALTPAKGQFNLEWI